MFKPEGCAKEIDGSKFVSCGPIYKLTKIWGTPQYCPKTGEGLPDHHHIDGGSLVFGGSANPRNMVIG